MSSDGERVVVRFKELQSTISDLISLDVNEVFTKEEMLAELKKPRIPKAGETFVNSSLDTVTVVHVTDKNVFLNLKKMVAVESKILKTSVLATRN